MVHYLEARLAKFQAKMAQTDLDGILVTGQKIFII